SHRELHPTAPFITRRATPPAGAGGLPHCVISSLFAQAGSPADVSRQSHCVLPPSTAAFRGGVKGNETRRLLPRPDAPSSASPSACLRPVPRGGVRLHREGERCPRRGEAPGGPRSPRAPGCRLGIARPPGSALPVQRRRLRPPGPSAIIGARARVNLAL